MSRGYVILAQNNDTDDYIRMAYAAAMSIKLTQSKVSNVALITDIPDAVPRHYFKVFDKVLPILWYDDAYKSNWKIENRWKLYHLTPYDETVVLDADMLFLSDVSNWWEYLNKNHDLMITNKVFTYRNEPIINSYYRRTFIENSLPNTYSAFTYFKKNNKSEIFWKMVELIVKNWEDFYQKFIKNSRPKNLSIDVAFSLAIKILGIEDEVFSTIEYPTFIHMKSRDQGWDMCTDNWTNHAGVYLNDSCQLKVGNYQQKGIFHYTEKDFLNEDIILKYETILGIFDE